MLPILSRKPSPSEPGIPIDVSRANLFDTTYVHQALRKSMILWEYYHYYIRVLLWVCSGTTSGMDQWVGEISRARHHPSKSMFSPRCSLLYYFASSVFLLIFFFSSLVGLSVSRCCSLLQQVHEGLPVLKLALPTQTARPIPLAIRLEICSSVDVDSRHAWKTGRSRTATKENR